MKEIKMTLKKYYEKIKANEYVRAFFYIYVVGLIIFSLEAAFNSFTLPMMGDYHMQTYAFYAQGYEVFWNFLKTGEFPLFDFSNFLGANYLGTQSFYYVFSPLFYLLCLWPKRFLYQGIFFHLVFKFALGGFFFYILLRRYFRVSKKMSWLGGFIYAFSGWSLFYLWFHFGDVVAFFPLFLIGIEKCLQERKGWLLSLGLLLCGCASYFFLVNFCIFGIFYALYRWIYLYGINKKRGYKASIRWGVLCQGILYYGIGVLLAGFILLPSLHVASQSARTESTYLLNLLSKIFQQPGYVDGTLTLGSIKPIKEIFQFSNLKELFKVLFIWDERIVSSTTIPGYQNIGYILSGWLFMNTNCWNATMFAVGPLDNAIGGMFITTPLTMLLIPSILMAVKKKRPWTIFGIIVCLILPFVPITSHLAFAFTNLYGRWQIWMVAIGILFIISTLDQFEKVDRRFVTFGLIINYALAALVFYCSKKSGMFPSYDMQIVFYAELGVMALVYIIYRFKIFKPALVKNIMVGICVIEIAVSSVVTLEHKGFYDWDTYYFSQPSYHEMEKVIDDLQAEDKDFYRIYNTEATRLFVNLPSTLNYAGSSTFNSTYDFELVPFIKRSRMAYNGGWIMGDNEKRMYYDQYIGTKYYIVDKKDINNDNSEYYRDRSQYFDGHTKNEEEKQTYNINIPIGYRLYKEYEYYDVYLNENYIGIGYTVDCILPHSNAGTSSYRAADYEQMYTQLAIVENEDVEQLSSMFDVVYSYTSQYEYMSQGSFNKYFSMRQDYEQDQIRKEYPIETIDKATISNILPSYSQFFHKRWEERNLFGDQIILELKDNYQSVCKVASKENKCYINLSFKLGPRVLISLYHDDVLVTQDAHMNCNSSLSDDRYEWKTQRGFYVDQPINKIVIEFIQDAAYSKVFNSDNFLNAIDMYYQYENQIQQNLQNNLDHKLYDVTYQKNCFTFKTNEATQRLAVTNIPYDDGWTLTCNQEEIPIYKVNGGFVGFVTPIGEVEYQLQYFTPQLKSGLMVTMAGLFLLIIVSFIYKNTRIDIKMIEEDRMVTYQQKIEKDDEEYMKIFAQTIKQKTRRFFYKIKESCSNVFDKFISLFKKRRG